MKFGAALLLFSSFLAQGNMQENLSTKNADPSSIGLEAGQKAPSFTSRDQFGHEQSIESLKGSNGTVLLFFRSADW
ncbi:MAG: hypothetical protein WB780_13430 [Candidatus Acidiferrales bacterium]